MKLNSAFSYESSIKTINDIDYFSKEFGVVRNLIKEAIEKTGSSDRKEIEKYLYKHKMTIH